MRARRGGLAIWRLQGTTRRAVFPGLPPGVRRDRARAPALARQVRCAPPGGLSLARGAVRCTVSPRAVSRPACAWGQQGLVPGLTRGGRPWPPSGWADEPPRQCLAASVPLPTRVRGRVRWPPDGPEYASAAAWTEASAAVHRAAAPQAPSSRGRGLLTDGVASPLTRLRTLCPGARLGHGLRHARTKRPPYTDGARVAGPHPGVPGAAAHRPAGGRAGPTGAARGPGHEGGLGDGARRPAAAGDRPATGASPQRQRPAGGHAAGLPSSPRPPTGVSARARPAVQRGA